MAAPDEDNPTRFGAMNAPDEEHSARSGAMAAPNEDNPAHLGAMDAPDEEHSARSGAMDAPDEDNPARPGAMDAPDEDNSTRLGAMNASDEEHPARSGAMYAQDEENSVRSGAMDIPDEEHRQNRAKTILEEFSDTTTLHGIPRAIRGRSWPVRCFWVVVFVGAASMCGYQLSELLRRYYTYPVRVTTKIMDSDMPFPDIYVCSMQPASMGNIERIAVEMTKENLTDFRTGKLKTGDDSLDMYLSYVGRYDLLRRKYKDDDEMRLPLDDLFSINHFVFRNLRIDSLSAENFMVSSEFAGEKHKMTTPVYSSFFPHTMPCRLFSADGVLPSEGMTNGWSGIVSTGCKVSVNLTLVESVGIIPGINDDRSVLSGSEGVRVLIVQKGLSPRPALEGFDVPPRTFASFAVRSRRVRRLGPPHGTCVNWNPMHRTAEYSGNEDYRLVDCLQACQQRHVIVQCGCYRDELIPPHAIQIDSNADSLQTDYKLPKCQQYDTYSDDFPPSCSLNVTDDCKEIVLERYLKVRCVRETASNVATNKSMKAVCNCRPPCNEVVYDVSYSASRWPADGPVGQTVWDDIFVEKKFLDSITSSTFNEVALYSFFMHSELDLFMKAAYREKTFPPELIVQFEEAYRFYYKYENWKHYLDDRDSPRYNQSLNNENQTDVFAVYETEMHDKWEEFRRPYWG